MPSPSPSPGFDCGPSPRPPAPRADKPPGVGDKGAYIDDCCATNTEAGRAGATPPADAAEEAASDDMRKKRTREEEGVERLRLESQERRRERREAADGEGCAAHNSTGERSEVDPLAAGIHGGAHGEEQRRAEEQCSEHNAVQRSAVQCSGHTIERRDRGRHTRGQISTQGLSAGQSTSLRVDGQERDTLPRFVAFESSDLPSLPPPRSSVMSSVREWSLEEISSHKRLSDCWLIISNRVYDVTEFLSRHPAGSKIVQMHGGRDCTAAFLDVHRERYLTQFLPAAAFKGIVAGTGAKAHTDKFVGQYWAPDQVLSMKRTVYTKEHEAYREKFKEFIAKQIHPVSAGRRAAARAE